MCVNDPDDCSDDCDEQDYDEESTDTRYVRHFSMSYVVDRQDDFRIVCVGKALG